MNNDTETKQKRPINRVERTSITHAKVEEAIARLNAEGYRFVGTSKAESFHTSELLVIGEDIELESKVADVCDEEDDAESDTAKISAEALQRANPSRPSRWRDA